MKNLYKILLISILCMNSMVGVASASASISNTGPGSNNSIDIEQTSNTDINCNNNIDVNNSNSQSSSSGNSSVDSNTSGGSATSGNSNNNNSSNITVNTGCAPHHVTTPTVSGKGSGTTASTAPQVVTPVGGVHAGGGAGAGVVSNGAVAGLIGSLGLTSFGLLIRKRALFVR